MPADDRGLAYGDGLFETMAVLDGRVRLLGHHLDRLCDSAERLRIPVGRAALASTLREHAHALKSGVLKLLLTRGSGPRGYAMPAAPAPRLLMLPTPTAVGFADQWRSPSAEAIAVHVCQTPLSINPLLAGMKHLNRLPQVLARSEWDHPEVAEGLMRADSDAIVCATAANVFAIRGTTVITPALEQAGVSGVMRRVVLEVARELGWEVVLEDLDLDLLMHRADAVLLSSALTGVRRIQRIAGESLARSAVPGRGGFDALRDAMGQRLERG